MASPLGSPVGGLPAAESFTSQPDVSEVLGLRTDSGATPVPTPPLSAAPRTSTSPLVLGAGAAPTGNDFVNTVQGTQGGVTEKDSAPPQAGIGVVLTPAPPDFQELQVAKVFDGGAAAKSGLIFEGDVIHSIDGALAGSSLEAVSAKLMGSVNTEVDLGIRRSGTVISCKLTRCVLSDSAIALQTALSRSGSASQSQVGSRRNSVASSPGPEDRNSPSQPLSPAPGMAGIGVILQPAPPDFVEFQVVEVVEGGVAQKSGLIFKDDIISAVDGTITAGRTLESVTSGLVGAVDTDVTVTIRRSGTELTAKLTRAPLNHAALSKAMRSASFTSGTPSSTGAQTPVYGAPDNIASFSSLPTPGGSVRSLQVDTQAAPDIPAAGIGVVLQPCPTNGEMQVMELIPGGAAKQSNLICEGDLVTAVNQVSTRNKSLQEVSSLLVGPVGTTVSIGLIRVSDGMETATTATITRAALCRTGSQAALKRVTSSRGSSAANSRPPSRAGSVTRGQISRGNSQSPPRSPGSTKALASPLLKAAVENQKRMSSAGAGTGGSSRDVSGAASPTSPPASNWDKVRASVQAQQSAGQLSKTGSVSSKTSTGSKGKYGLLKRWMSGKEIKRAEAAEDQLLEAQSVAAEAVAQVRLLEKQLEESQSQLQMSQRQLEESQRQLQESQGQVAKLRAELGEVTAERDEAVQAASILINEPELEGEEFNVLLSVLPDEEVRKMSNLSVNSSLLNTSAANSSIIREVLASRETQAATLSSETALFSGDILKDAPSAGIPV